VAASIPGSKRLNHKELVLEAIRKLPDDATIDAIDAIDAIDGRAGRIAALRKDIEDPDRGAVAPLPEVEGQLAAWLSSPFGTTAAKLPRITDSHVA
jgi:hypothetical protein